MKKRVLSLLLVLCLLLGFVPTTARAAQDITITKTDIEADSVVNYDGYASIQLNLNSGLPETHHSLIDPKGQILQSYTESEAFAFGTSGYVYSEGFVSIGSTSYGYIFEPISSKYYNLDGSVAFEIESSVERAKADLAQEYEDWEYGEIERETSLKPFQDGVAFIRDQYRFRSGSPGTDYHFDYVYSYLINTKGEIIYTFPDSFNEVAYNTMATHFYGNCGWAGEGLIPVSLYTQVYDDDYSGHYEDLINGYMDYNGNIVLDFLNSEYTNCFPFYDGRAMVCKEDYLYGYIDKTGKEIISCQYEEGNPFTDGLAAVCKDGKWGAINTDGAVVIPMMYDDSYGTGEGYMTVGMDGKYGLVDMDNNVIIPMEYDDISIVSEGVAYAIKDRVLYIIEVGAAANPFTDVPVDKYYHDPVLWAYENGITAGATATTFNPNGDCTRGQIVTFLWRAAGCPEPKTTSNPFTDVDSDDYFYKAVLWAVETGVTAGATKTTFNPKGACNRAQVVTFMYRAAGSPAITSANNPFQDVPADKYYHDAVLWAVENGITSGVSSNKFAPNNTCTRGQIVTFLYRGYAK